MRTNNLNSINIMEQEFRNAEKKQNIALLLECQVICLQQGIKENYELFNLALTMMGFPEDNSTDPKYDEFWQMQNPDAYTEGMFCRDYLEDLFFEHKGGQYNLHFDYTKFIELLEKELEDFKNPKAISLLR